MAKGIRVMNKYARIMCLVAAGLTIAGAAFAQDYTRVRPRGHQFGSEVCPEGYGYHRGWCLRGNDWTAGERYRGRERYGHHQRGFGYEGPSVPPRWNSRGSAVCPENYDYFIEFRLCMPRVESRAAPSWNGRGSAVCPEFYDYYGGQCIAREQTQREPEHEPDSDDDQPVEYGNGLGVPRQWNTRGSAVCPDDYDYIAESRLCMPRG
jgi:hypothetical protein